MTFLDLVLRNVAPRTASLGVTIGGIGIALAAALSLISFARGLEHAMAQSYQAHGIDVVVVRAGVAERLTSSLPISLTASLRALPRCRSGQSQPLRHGPARQPESVGSAGAWLVRRWFSARRTAVRGRTSLGRLAPATRLARTLPGCEPGQERERHARHRRPDVSDCGHLFRHEPARGCATAIVRLRDLPETDGPRRASDRVSVAATTRLRADRAELDALCRRISELHNLKDEPWGLTALPTQNYVTGGAEIRLAHAMAVATSLVALVVGATAMLNTTTMSVLDRTPESAFCGPSAGAACESCRP